MARTKDDSHQNPQKQQGSRKRSPREDLYLASQAIEITGLAASTFQRLVREKKIPKEVPYGHKEGFYPKIFIEMLLCYMTIRGYVMENRIIHLSIFCLD